MRHFGWILLCTLILGSFTSPTESQAREKKKWALLVFINGFNNLDRFGAKDINEMETVGSTKDTHVVVQWASLRTKQVKRVHVQKDNDPYQVTSPVVESLGQIDMGDYRNLVEFVRWASERYPAEHYFVDVWNHGSGWHKSRLIPGVRDISSDDLSGNHITTEQLGTALNEIAAHLGRKVSIYGSDACLMGMIEVAAEMKNSVDVYVGSQHLEPGDGWPYDRLLSAWEKEVSPTPERIATILTRVFAESYPRSTEITLSAYRMSTYEKLAGSLRAFSRAIEGISSDEMQKLKGLAQDSTRYFYADYKDLGEFLSKVAGSSLKQEVKLAAAAAHQDVRNFVVANQFSSDLPNASGVSVWIPNSSYNYGSHASRYSSLVFNRDSSWLQLAEQLAR